MQQLGAPDEVNPKRERPDGRMHEWRKTYLWTEVAAEVVKTFLGGFLTHERAPRADSRLLRDYIVEQERIGELVTWAVVLLSGGEGGVAQVGDLGIDLIKREPKSPVEEQKASGRYTIRRLLSPRDEAIDLDLAAYQRALEKTIEWWHQDRGKSQRQEPPTAPSGPGIRTQRDPRCGLLLLYPLSHETAGVEGSTPIIGFGISFPESANARHIAYRVNNIYWAQEYGGEL